MAGRSSSLSGGDSVAPLGHAVGGALGSALALLLFYPLERARIEMQAAAAPVRDQEFKNVPTTTSTVRHDSTVLGGQDRPIEAGELSDSSESWDTCLNPDDEAPTKTTQVEAPRQQGGNSNKKDGLVPTLVQLHNCRELYQGVTPVVITLATSNFVFFYSHQVLQRLLIGEEKSATRSLLASSLAGMLNVIITNPLWVANMKIVKGSAMQSSLWREVCAIGRSEGWANLWNGAGASLLLVSNPVLQFFVYEQAKAARVKKRSTLSPVEAFFMGALAKAIATIATYPLQLTQVLLRLQKGGGTWDCLRQQYRRGGIPALYTGMNAKLIQTVLTAAFTFLTYEQILRVVRATALVVTVQKQQQQRQKLASDM